MAVQSSFYTVDGTTLTYPSSKHIPTKAHMAVWIQRISDDVYEQVNVTDYELINKSAVLKEAVDVKLYQRIEIRVADTPDELGDSPSDISIVASIPSEIAIVAGIEDEVITVAGLQAEILSIFADKATLDSIYADKATLDSLFADKATLDSLYADKATLDSLYADKATLDSLYADKASLDAIFANLTEILEADLRAWEAEAEAMTAESYAVEPEDIVVKVYTSNGDGTFTATPTTDYSALHWAAKSEAASPIAQTPTPILSGVASGNENTVVNITIDNYDAVLTYGTPVVSGGSAIRTGDTIAWTLPDVASDTAHTLSITAEWVGIMSVSLSGVHNTTVLNVPIVPDQAYLLNSANMTEASVHANTQLADTNTTVESIAIDTTNVLDGSSSADTAVVPVETVIGDTWNIDGTDLIIGAVTDLGGGLYSFDTTSVTAGGTPTTAYINEHRTLVNEITQDIADTDFVGLDTIQSKLQFTNISDATSSADTLKTATPIANGDNLVIVKDADTIHEIIASGVTGPVTGIYTLDTTATTAGETPSRVFAVDANPSFQVSAGFIEATKVGDVFTIPALDATFDTVLYTGTSATQNIPMTNISTGVDFVWIKNRGSALSHILLDSMRGAYKRISSDTTGAEVTDTGFGVGTFGTSSFTVEGAGGFSNLSGNTYVAFCASLPIHTPSNTDGSITSEVKSNGWMSVVSYTGNATAGATVGHGLGSAPDLIIVKSRTTGTHSWHVYDSFNGATKELKLNTTQASATNAFWNNTEPTSTVFSLGGTAWEVNESGDNYIAYAFTDKVGVCKIGSYIGTGASGNSVDCGFEPAWVMIKRADSTGDWIIVDAQRGIGAGNDPYLQANSSNVEDGLGGADDILDAQVNGFTMSTAWATVNASGGTYIFMAISNTMAKEILYTTRTHNDVYDATGSRTIRHKHVFNHVGQKLTEVSGTINKN